MKGSRRAINRYDLYEWCVQAPDMQARFLRALHGGRPRRLCEDFCGPASIARAWALLDESYLGTGVDRDHEPLRHARLRAAEQGIDPARFKVRRADVRRTAERADVIAAFNFAACELHERGELLAYLRRVRARLPAGGIVAIDLYGGRDAHRPGVTRVRRRTPGGLVYYAWEQRSADPITARVRNAMHFRLGSRSMRNAFEYDWRLWTIAEARETLAEAGFRSAEVHFDYGGAIDGDGNPVPVAAEPGDAIDENYVAYIVGRR